MKSILLFFGSGLSIPAKMSSTWEITNSVINGNNISRTGNGNYFFDSTHREFNEYKDEYVKRILPFIQKLKMEIDLYYKSNPKHKTNYEDLFYIASQIYDSEIGNLDNPIVQPFIAKIYDNLKTVLEMNEDDTIREMPLHELAKETMHYIHDQVWQKLSKKPSDLSYLKFLKEAYEDTRIGNISIFTLNHDIILEKYFEYNNIDIIDGFDKAINEVRYWNYKNYNKSQKISLVKLHGSINWFKFSRSKYCLDQIGISTNRQLWRTKDQKGKNQYLSKDRPIILVGTFNKIIEYTYDIYYQLNYLLYENLLESDTIIISGYSFGDKGINTRLVEWMTTNIKNKIILIHPDLEKLKLSSRGGIYFRWNDWVKDRKLILIEEGIQNISWEDIYNKL